MRIIPLILVIVLNAKFVNAQIINEPAVPTPVKVTFYSICPETIVDKIDTVPVKWKKGRTRYLAQFQKDDVTKYVTIGLKGNWIETKASIKTIALSKKISDYIRVHYPQEKIISSFQIKHFTGKDTYEAELDVSTLFFDTDGNLISAKKKTISKKSP